MPPFVLPPQILAELQARYAQEQQHQLQPEEISSIEQLDAYVEQKVKEVDELIALCEKNIVEMKPCKARSWLEGVHKGLELARAAWSWWKRPQQ